MLKILRNSIRARRHIRQMAKYHQGDIDYCIKSTRWCSRPIQTCVVPIPDLRTSIEVVPLDTVEAIFKYREWDMCVLNFANPTVAGGMFLDGSSGQEESLCHHSYLYNILNGCKDWFDENRNLCNDYLYTDRALYTPDVRFDDGKGEGNIKFADVLTCPAPNAMKRKWTKGADDGKTLEQALRHRIDFILQIAAHEQPDALVLGAFGCGHFDNDPRLVATIFEKLLHKKYNNVFKKVVFAIPRSDKNDHYEIFCNVFRQNA